MTTILGIDLGGTNILATRFEDGADVASSKVSTSTISAEGIVDQLVELARTVGEGAEAIGVGTPGVVEPGSGRVLRAPNLAGFDQPVDLATLLHERLATPVLVANDVNAAAYGEARRGRGAEFDDILAIWLGTGVGGGLVLDGRLRTGPHGLAGEIGHVTVVPGGRTCPCGGAGHLEAYLGRRGLEIEARRRHAAGDETALVDKAGDGPMKSKTFARCLAAGDPVTVALIDEGIEMLAIAVANTLLTVDVSAVLIGGGLGERIGDRVAEGVIEGLASLHFAGASPQLLLATLGGSAGTVGAALLAEAALLEG